MGQFPLTKIYMPESNLKQKVSLVAIIPQLMPQLGLLEHIKNAAEGTHEGFEAVVC